MKKRIDILDLWRTVAIVCMAAYHLLYDLAIFGFLGWGAMFSPGLNAFERFICCSFILLSGISSRFSRSNVRRGLITFGCALLVSLAGYVTGEPIWFGILHFLGCAMLLYGLLGKFFERVPKIAAPILWLALFFLTKYWTDNTLVGVGFLFPLGFRAANFVSADYFPLFPWFFLFLLGAWAGGALLELRDTGGLKFLGLKPRETARRVFDLRVPKALTWPGRHSLVIYMLHQPILYGLVWLIARGG